MGAITRAIEIRAPHFVRGQAQVARHPPENLLDDKHALRSAKTAKRRIRRLVRGHHAPRGQKVGHRIRVVDVEKRTPQNRLGQIEAVATVAEELDHQG